MFKDLPSCTTTISCNTCKDAKHRSMPTININVDIILKNGLGNMQNAIKDTCTMQHATFCATCQNPATSITTYGPHLVIDTSVFTDIEYIRSIDVEEPTCSLNTIAKSIKMNNQHYNIAGIVSYHQYQSGTNNGHYTALTYTGSNWYNYDDIMTNRTSTNINDRFYPHVIIYVIN